MIRNLEKGIQWAEGPDDTQQHSVATPQCFSKDVFLRLLPQENNLYTTFVFLLMIYTCQEHRARKSMQMQRTLQGDKRAMCTMQRQRNRHWWNEICENAMSLNSRSKSTGLGNYYPPERNHLNCRIPSFRDFDCSGWIRWKVVHNVHVVNSDMCSISESPEWVCPCDHPASANLKDSTEHVRSSSWTNLASSEWCPRSLHRVISAQTMKKNQFQNLKKKPLIE